MERQIPSSHVFLLIADQHAWLANNFDLTKALKIAQHLQFKVFTQVINSLLFPQALPASYETLEIRDVNHFISHHQVGIKIGWKFGSGQNHKTDEAHFDQNLNIVSVFTKPGVTSDPNKPQESPYICTDPATRILLQPHQPHLGGVVENLAVQNHLKRITILFEQLFGNFPPKTPVEQKVALILKTIFK